jgi:hypothetical protein
MSASRRSRLLALAVLAFSACARFQPLSGPVRETVPRIGNREALVTDTTGRVYRLNTVHLQGDSLVGLGIDDARPVALSSGQIRQIEVLTTDPISGFGTTSGVILLIGGAVAVAALIAHSTGR